MDKIIIAIDGLVHQSMGRMSQLRAIGSYILCIQMSVVGAAFSNLLFLDTNLDNYIALFCVFVSLFGLYCQKRITRHMTVITDSLDNLTGLLDPRKFMSPDLVLAQVKLFKYRIELPFSTIIFKVF